MAYAQAGLITYDPAAAFSITNGNPNGVWSYGHYATLETPSSFSAYDTATTNLGGQVAGIEGWAAASNPSYPYVSYNPTSGTITAPAGWGLWWTPGALVTEGSDGGGTANPLDRPAGRHRCYIRRVFESRKH